MTTSAKGTIKGATTPAKNKYRIDCHERSILEDSNNDQVQDYENGHADYSSVILQRSATIPSKLIKVAAIAETTSTKTKSTRKAVT